MRRDQGIIRDGSNNPARPTGNGFSGRKVRPMCANRSRFVTTRMYSPSGAQIWNGDHGYTVQAMTVGPDGVVYQTGSPNGIDLGDSLFHKQGGTRPLVTAMMAGGRPVWSWTPTPAGSSLGIAYATTEHVYVGVNVNPFIGNGYLVKLNTRTAAEVSRLSVDGFEHTIVPGSSPPFVTSLPDAQAWTRVRVDGDNNIYAIGATDGNVNSSVMKWVDDSEFWMWDEQFGAYFHPSGLAVTSDGIVASSSEPGVASTTNAPMYYLMETDVNNQSTPAFSPYLIKKKRTSSGPDYPGYLGNAISPNGSHSLTIDHTAGGSTYDLIEIAASADPFAPTITTRQSGINPRYQALAVNDSGVYAYAVSRAHLGHSVEVYNADNTLRFQVDHGGEINDPILLPDGTLYLAGERVLRSDYP